MPKNMAKKLNGFAEEFSRSRTAKRLKLERGLKNNNSERKKCKKKINKKQKNNNFMIWR